MAIGYDYLKELTEMSGITELARVSREISDMARYARLSGVMAEFDGPPPFHAFYSGDQASISIEGLGVLTGRLPPRATGLVTEWATLHQSELRETWGRATKLEPLGKIEPLRRGSSMKYRVVSLEARPNFKLWVQFADGVEGEADLSDIAGCGVFQRWVDNPGEFAKVTIDPVTGAPSWPGDLDVAPDGLYAEIAEPARTP